MNTLTVGQINKSAIFYFFDILHYYGLLCFTLHNLVRTCYLVLKGIFSILFLEWFHVMFLISQAFCPLCFIRFSSLFIQQNDMFFCLQILWSSYVRILYVKKFLIVLLCWKADTIYTIVHILTNAIKLLYGGVRESEVIVFYYRQGIRDWINGHQ